MPAWLRLKGKRNSMTRDQHMRSAECLDELMVLGELVQTVADQSQGAPENLSSRWVQAIGRLTMRMASNANELAGTSAHCSHGPRDPVRTMVVVTSRR